MYEDLLEEASKHVSRNDEIKSCECSRGEHPAHCYWCGDEWPCLTSRLRDSLKKARWSIGHLKSKYDEDMEQLRREQVGDLSVVTERIDAVRSVISSGRVFRTSLGQPVIDVGYIWEALGEGEE